MYVPSAASASPDQKSPRRMNADTLALVAAEGHELGDGAADRAELDRDHARVAHHFAAASLDLPARLVQVRNLDGEMVDAGPVAGCLRFPRLRARVVLHEREVDLPVGHVARHVVARLGGLRIAKI